MTDTNESVTVNKTDANESIKRGEKMKISRTKIELAMAGRQMTIGDMCNKTGIPRVTVSQVLRGVREPKPKTVGRIAQALNVEPKDLIED